MISQKIDEFTNRSMTETIKPEFDFKKFETTFHNIEKNAQNLTATKSKELQNVTSLIEQTFLNSNKRIQNDINNQREVLIKQTKSEFSRALLAFEASNLKFSNATFQSTKNDHLRRLRFYLLGKLSYSKEMRLLKKIKYSDICELFLNIGDASSMQENDHSIFKVYDIIFKQQNNEHNLIHGCQFLISTGNETANFLKIVNQQFEDLHTHQINTELNLSEVMCSTSIVAIFRHVKTKAYHIHIFDLKLRKLTGLRIHQVIKLVSLSSEEIICWLPNSKELIIYDYFLKEKISYGQDTMVNEPFYFGNGSLAYANKDYILFYYNNLGEDPELEYCSEESKDWIKIMKRADGKCISTMEFNYDYFSRNFQMNVFDEIMYKPFSNNDVSFYDLDGKLVKNFSCRHFANMETSNPLRLSMNKQLIFLDKKEFKVLAF